MQAGVDAGARRKGGVLWRPTRPEDAVTLRECRGRLPVTPAKLGAEPEPQVGSVVRKAWCRLGGVVAEGDVEGGEGPAAAPWRRTSPPGVSRGMW